MFSLAYSLVSRSRFWGFQHISHTERYHEREYAINPQNAKTKFDFVCVGGRSNHFNPSKNNRGWRYYVPASGRFTNQFYGPGKCFPLFLDISPI